MDKKHYEVGYGKPPKGYQFKKGNPGRSRSMRNIAHQKAQKYLTWDQVFSKVLEERMTVSERGKRKKMTKMEVFARSIINDAMKGDRSARRTLVTLAPKLVEPPGVEIWTTRVTAETLHLFDTVLHEAKEYLSKDGAPQPEGWPAPGSTDTELGVFMGPEVSHGTMRRWRASSRH